MVAGACVCGVWRRDGCGVRWWIVVYERDGMRWCAAGALGGVLVCKCGVIVLYFLFCVLCA